MGENYEWTHQHLQHSVETEEKEGREFDHGENKEISSKLDVLQEVRSHSPMALVGPPDLTHTDLQHL